MLFIGMNNIIEGLRDSAWPIKGMDTMHTRFDVL